MRRSKPSPPPPTVKYRVFVAPGLEDQDDEIDKLEGFFKEMQKTTVETAQPDDFLSFASCAHFFGVIMLETITTPAPVTSDDESDEDQFDNDAQGEPEDETEEAESAYPASSRPTSPPVSTMSRAASNNDVHSSARDSTMEGPSRNRLDDPDLDLDTLSEQEKVLLWREAFMAQIEEDAINDPYPGIKPKRYEDSSGFDSLSDKGKLPEFNSPSSPLSPNPFLVPHTLLDGSFPTEKPPGANSHVMEPDFINWPDEDPSAEDHGRQSIPQEPSSFHTFPEPMDYDTDISTQHMNEDKDIGREYLEPDQTPVHEMPEIPVNPKVQAMIYDAAIRFQNELRMNRIKSYQESKRRKARESQRQLRKATAKAQPPAPVAPTKVVQPIGLIYLWTSQTFLDFLHMGECSMGMFVTEQHRRRENLVTAVNYVVELAFKDPECHRIQSIIVENPDKLYSLELLAKSGFRNEGIRRRAFYSPLACEWKDVTYFAMLATEWVYDCNNTSAARIRTNSLWDEVFARHQKECDDLIRLEEKSSLKRSASTETIRVAKFIDEAPSEIGETSGEATDTTMESEASSSKRRRVDLRRSQEVVRSRILSSRSSASDAGLDSEWDLPLPSTAPRSVPSRPGNPPFSRRKRPSISGSSSSGISDISGVSSSSSQWVVLDD